MGLLYKYDKLAYEKFRETILYNELFQTSSMHTNHGSSRLKQNYKFNELMIIIIGPERKSNIVITHYTAD